MTPTTCRACIARENRLQESGRQDFAYIAALNDVDLFGRRRILRELCPDHQKMVYAGRKASLGMTRA